MRIRSTVPRLLLAAVCGGALLSVPLITAPPAAACSAGEVSDPVTGICWDATSTGSVTLTGTGGTCMPGRLGLCLGALQNSQIPGENLQPQPAAGPSRQPGTWP